jgi:gamma-tubulin complex component 2
MCLWCVLLYSLLHTTPLKYAIQGIEGVYITFHPEYSAEDDDPLLGIRFVASSSLGA